MTIREIHQSIEKGLLVCWENELYEVVQVAPRENNLEHDLNHPSYCKVSNKLLQSNCVENEFGCLVDGDEISACYVEYTPTHDYYVAKTIKRIEERWAKEGKDHNGEEI